MNLSNGLRVSSVAGLLALASGVGFGAQLSSDARSAIPYDVQQMVVVDYRVMQNSPVAMQLRGQVMPPELKQLEESLQKAGLNDNHDLDQLAFVLYRTTPGGEEVQTVGVAQGQFPVQDVLANFRKQRLKPTVVRGTNIYPLGATGMSVVFLDESTMVFGGLPSVKKALDVRDGLAQGFLTNNSMMDAMKSVDSQPLWSILDQKGTQTMMKQVFGQMGQMAGSVSDFDTVKKLLVDSWYSMDFQHGVQFDLAVQSTDNFAVATISSLLNAAVLYKKMSGTDSEKMALDGARVSSSGGRLNIHFGASDDQFQALLKSDMFQSMVH